MFIERRAFANRVKTAGAWVKVEGLAQIVAVTSGHLLESKATQNQQSAGMLVASTGLNPLCPFAMVGGRSTQEA